MTRGKDRRIGAGNRTCAGTYSQSSSIVRWCVDTVFATCVYRSRDEGKRRIGAGNATYHRTCSKQHRPLAGAPAPLLLDASSTLLLDASSGAGWGQRMHRYRLQSSSTDSWRTGTAVCFGGTYTDIHLVHIQAQKSARFARLIFLYWAAPSEDRGWYPRR